MQCTLLRPQLLNVHRFISSLRTLTSRWLHHNQLRPKRFASLSGQAKIPILLTRNIIINQVEREQVKPAESLGGLAVIYGHDWLYRRKGLMCWPHYCPSKISTFFPYYHIFTCPFWWKFRAMVYKENRGIKWYFERGMTDVEQKILASWLSYHDNGSIGGAVLAVTILARS